MYPLAHMGIPLFALSRIRRDINIRLFLVALMLPDIIDKPVGHLLLSSLNNGRIFAHTLLFLSILLLLSLAFRSEKILWIALGVAIHDTMDMIFLQPETFLWPLLGPFPRGEFTPYSWVEGLITSPFYIGGEVAGGLLMLYLSYEYGYLERVPLLNRFFKRRVEGVVS